MLPIRQFEWKTWVPIGKPEQPRQTSQYLPCGLIAPTYSSPSLTAMAIAWPATCSGSFLRIQFLSALKFKPATAGLEARTLLSALSFPTTQPLTQESKDRYKLFYIATLHFKSSSALNFDLFLKKCNPHHFHVSWITLNATSFLISWINVLLLKIRLLILKPEAFNLLWAVPYVIIWFVLVNDLTRFNTTIWMLKGLVYSGWEKVFWLQVF